MSDAKSEDRHLKQLNDIDHGRRAVLAWDTFGGLFEFRKAQLLSELLSAYRAKKTPQEIYDYVAGLNAIDELAAAINRTITKGNQSGKDLLK